MFPVRAAAIRVRIDFIRARGRHHHLDLHLGQQVDVVLLAPVDLFVALLPAMTAHLGDGHAVDADALEGFFYFLELERLDDCLNLLHRSESPFYASKL